MSEPKRVVPQSLEFPDSLGHATKKEKKREKGKQLAPSYRFTIALPESNDTVYSEINYGQLVKLKEKKRRKSEQRTDDENATNGLDPFGGDGDDDEDKLREVAKRFEAKYGTATAGRKRHKFDDDVDLGAGYDENDSFIDNTDAYDEIVPAEMTTAYGGFYINSGPLEFRPAENDNPVQNCLNNINNNNNEDENSEENVDNTDDEEDEGNQVLKRLEKRILSCSEDEEEDEDEDNADIPPRKKYKSEENGDKKSNSDIVAKKKRKPHTDQSNQNSGEDGETVNARKNLIEDKREILDLECSSEDQEDRKKGKYEIGRTKTTGEKKKFDIRRFEKKSSTNGVDVKKIDLKKLVGKDSNIDDAIESVVNAGRAEDESSRDTMDSGKSRGLAGTESDCDEMDKEETPLPEQLPEDMKETINKLKSHVEKIKEVKGKVFDEFVNATLLSLDEKLRVINSPSARLLTYGHLAHFLRCSKSTLINRTKKLCLQEADNKVKVPIQRLRAVVEAMMPTVVERYAKECQRVAEEKNAEGSPAEGESSDAENSEKSKIPRKKFPWSTETKKLVYEIARARRHYFKIRKPRKESLDSFVATFMEAKVLPLWPAGWVRLNTLLKYANPEPVEKRKQKKLRDGSIPSSVTTAAVSNSSTRVEAFGASVANSASTASHERTKSPILSMTGQTAKSVDASTERKQTAINAKHREKNNDSPVSVTHPENVASANNQSLAKISVVPTCQLMAQKPLKTIGEKFNPMDLTSSSLSITPVNDYQKPTKLPTETKKDVISITPYNEPAIVSGGNDAVVISPSVGPISSSRPDVTSYSLPNSTATIKPVPSVKNRPQDNSDGKCEKKSEDRSDADTHRADKREKKRDRWTDEKHRSHESKKRRKEQKSLEIVGQQQQQTSASAKSCDVAPPVATQPSLSKEEQQRQIEETMAATNFLSQIINDDSPRSAVEARKDQPVSGDDSATTGVQPSEQDNNVQMVMRSLKELQELQEIKHSPSLTTAGGLQKPSKSSHQYAGYQDDYHRLYAKKEDKIRVAKEDTPW